MADHSLALLAAEALTVDSPPEDVLDCIATCDAVTAKLREFAQAVQTAKQESVIPWLQANGDLEDGQGARYYVAKKKREKLRDPVELLIDLLDEWHGDAERIGQALSANPVKLSAIPQNVRAKHFEVEVTDELRIGKTRPK